MTARLMLSGSLPLSLRGSFLASQRPGYRELLHHLRSTRYAAAGSLLVAAFFTSTHR